METLTTSYSVRYLSPDGLRSLTGSISNSRSSLRNPLSPTMNSNMNANINNTLDSSPNFNHDIDDNLVDDDDNNNELMKIELSKEEKINMEKGGDIWAFGVICWELIHEKQAWEGFSVETIGKLMISFQCEL